jgi:hypothetical protein
MDFILRYRGPIHANGNTKEKHTIRQAIHRQLTELCTQEPLFHSAQNPDLPEGRLESQQFKVPRPLKKGGFYTFSLRGFQFVPIINKPHELACSLEILMLRREKPGAIISHGGDIDNRLKTLFDALRMPHHESELLGVDCPATEERMYCLLEDDCLITKVAVNTQQLLEPLSREESSSTVELLMHVFIQSTYPMWGNVGF